MKIARRTTNHRLTSVISYFTLKEILKRKKGGPWMWPDCVDDDTFELLKILLWDKTDILIVASEDASCKSLLVGDF